MNRNCVGIVTKKDASRSFGWSTIRWFGLLDVEGVFVSYRLLGSCERIDAVLTGYFSVLNILVADGKDALSISGAAVLESLPMAKGNKPNKTRPEQVVPVVVDAGLDIKVIPNAPKTMVVGRDGQVWRIKVAGVPEDGRANRELINWMAESLGVPKGAVVMLKGEHARLKSVRIKGMNQDACDKRLESMLGQTV